MGAGRCRWLDLDKKRVFFYQLFLSVEQEKGQWRQWLLLACIVSHIGIYSCPCSSIVAHQCSCLVVKLPTSVEKGQWRRWLLLTSIVSQQWYSCPLVSTVAFIPVPVVAQYQCSCPVPVVVHWWSCPVAYKRSPRLPPLPWSDHQLTGRWSSKNIHRETFYGRDIRL